MEDYRCVDFLQWALPRLHMRWPGFRKVRRQVCRRVDRRARQLGLGSVQEYRAYLDAHAGEWTVLDSLCRITISRFNRDRAVFRALGGDVLPALASAVRARGEKTLRVWSAGCASGEEPYTLAILWHLELQPRFPGLGIDVIATDIDARMLQRARDARYGFGSLKELPAGMRKRVFAEDGDGYVLNPDYRGVVRFLEQDIRKVQPDGPFDLVLCRNLVFTYLDADLQRKLTSRIVDRLRPGGALVIGVHERLPERTDGLTRWLDSPLGIYMKSTGRSRP